MVSHRSRKPGGGRQCAGSSCARRPVSAASRSPAASRRVARMIAAASRTCGSGARASTSAMRASHSSASSVSPRSTAHPRQRQVGAYRLHGCREPGGGGGVDDASCGRLRGVQLAALAPEQAVVGHGVELRNDESVQVDVHRCGEVALGAVQVTCPQGGRPAVVGHDDGHDLGPGHPQRGQRVRARPAGNAAPPPPPPSRLRSGRAPTRSIQQHLRARGPAGGDGAVCGSARG